MSTELAGDLTAETVLGDRYAVNELIGRGGMASVYRAEDQQLGRTVAIKVFADGTDADTPTARKRSEVRVLASLNHPSLVTLFDANLEAEPSPYLVMEYVDGSALDRRLRSGPISPADVAAMLKDLSDALAVVHAAGIVHRDIKPGNVLLTGASGSRTFRAKLADFGIAQLADGSRLTVPGTFMGTAAYVAPEQLGHAAPAPPADIYSLGLVVLECLTGVRAFAGSAAESISARVGADPGIPQSVPVAFRGLLAAMTSRDPAARPSAAEVHAAAVEVERALEDETPSEALATAPMVDDDLLAETKVLRAGPTAPTDVAAVSPGDRGAETAPRLWVRGLRRALPAIVGTLVIVAMLAVGTSGILASPPADVPQLPAMNAPMSTHFEQLLEAVTP